LFAIHRILIPRVRGRPTGIGFFSNFLAISLIVGLKMSGISVTNDDTP
jgi:hypothetical protein